MAFFTSVSKEIAHITATNTGRGIASRLRSFLSKCGFTNIEIKGTGPRGGLPYASGFAESPKGLWYFSTSCCVDTLLMRTAQHRKDWTGGHNMYPHDAEDCKSIAGL